MKKIKLFAFVCLIIFSACKEQPTMSSEEILLRESYVSTLDKRERDYFVYLPRGYDTDKDREWPLILFLHGNGERGNGKEELDYIITRATL